MPHAFSPTRERTGITRLTNCRLVLHNQLVRRDLWISSITGKILEGQEIFYSQQIAPDTVIDLGGRIVAPGFIDVQFNGAFGVDFSKLPGEEADDEAKEVAERASESRIAEYVKSLAKLNRELVKTGVTSYLPTIISQKAEIYHQVLPYLGPSGQSRNSSLGSESLGAHCEGPFLSPTKAGIHSPSVLLSAPNDMRSLEDCYGKANLARSATPSEPSPIRLITAAPEVEGVSSCISELVDRGFIFSIGHTESTYEEASAAVSAGATMITHLFNAMRPLHHRNPGPFGLLGTTSASPTSKLPQRPFFGLISDGIHLHPTTVSLAHSSHPSGTILVTDAMSLVGLPDGTYPWTNGSRITKRGQELVLEGTDRIAGSGVTLLQCVENFLEFTGCELPEAVAMVTATPAKMLGLEGVKGGLVPGADADLVVLDLQDGKGRDGGRRTLKVEQVWKFGCLVHEAQEDKGEAIDGA
ncbi:N-acetyl-glucosamine-6-phosphate deacetylase [Zalaria obscura]|uniref:N-acetyl-glucosamine-6-phosphate deacetylase n=1 Tax=Zalaria obscura TaxID=2024903 RepID=A0ACC3S3N8_9PEZI